MSLARRRHSELAAGIAVRARPRSGPGPQVAVILAPSRLAPGFRLPRPFRPLRAPVKGTIGGGPEC
jgi:hypothetical protein